MGWRSFRASLSMSRPVGVLQEHKGCARTGLEVDAGAPASRGAECCHEKLQGSLPGEGRLPNNLAGSDRLRNLFAAPPSEPSFSSSTKDQAATVDRVQRLGRHKNSRELDSMMICSMTSRIQKQMSIRRVVHHWKYFQISFTVQQRTLQA